MIPASDILPAVVVALLYVVLFAAFELLGRRTDIDKELTRKGVHIGSGLIALSFPKLFSTHLTVLVLGALFGMGLLVARRLKLLPSVHGVERDTVGELLYPVAIYGTLLVTTLTSTHVLYPICVLALALGDGLAGIIGTRVASPRYRVLGGTKSLAGSATFLVVTFACAAVVLSIEGAGVERALLVAAVASFMMTGLEAVSTHGTDNVTVALGGWGILYVATGRGSEELAVAAGVLGVLAMAAVLLIWSGRGRSAGSPLRGTPAPLHPPGSPLRGDPAPLHPPGSPRSGEPAPHESGGREK